MSNPEINNNEAIDNFEELEQNSSNEEELIDKKKKSHSKNLNKIFIKFLIINITIFPIIYIIYITYNNKNLSKSITYEKASNSKDKLQEINLKINHIINYTNDESANNEERKKFPTESIAQFPSGNIISVDWISIVIYDKNYDIKQRIYVFDVVDKKHYWRMQQKIYKISIKDDNNFAVYSNDGLLKIYTKQGDQFELKQEITDIKVQDAIFDSKGKLIVCVRGNFIKILEQNEKGMYKSIKSLVQADASYLTLFEDKNILISKEIIGLQFYDIKQNYKLIESLKERSIHELERIGDDKFILYHNNSLKILSIKERKVVKTVKIGFEAYSIKYCKEKGVILVGGIQRKEKGEDIGELYIMNSDNFELIKSIENIHGNRIRGIFILKNGLIATYGDDRDKGYPIKIWSLESN